MAMLSEAAGIDERVTELIANYSDIDIMDELREVGMEIDDIWTIFRDQELHQQELILEVSRSTIEVGSPHRDYISEGRHHSYPKKMLAIKYLKSLPDTGKEKYRMLRIVEYIERIGLVEMSAVLFVLVLSSFEYTKLSISVIAVILFCVFRQKVQMMEDLKADTTALLKLAYEDVLGGRHRLCGQSLPVTRKSTMALRSMPPFLERMTTALSLPETEKAWLPTAQARWANAWSPTLLAFVGHTRLPDIVLALFVLSSVMCAILCYVNLRRARRTIEHLGKAFCTMNGGYFPVFCSPAIRNVAWGYLAFAARHANIVIFNLYARAMMEHTKNEASEDGCLYPSFEVNVGEWPSGLSFAIGRLTIFGRTVLGPSYIIVQVLLVSGLRVWLKISVLADTYDDLSTSGKVSLTCAILMGLYSIMQSLPYQYATAFPKNLSWRQLCWSNWASATAALREIPLFIATCAFVLALITRLLGVWLCASRNLNLSSARCMGT